MSVGLLLQGGAMRDFAPSRTLKIKRMERNAENLQEMYDLGVEDCKANLDSLKKYLS